MSCERCVMCSNDITNYLQLYVCGTCFTRQGRTIRRLFMAYFLAKASANQWRKLYQDMHAAMGSMDTKAEEEERARIVAALREKAAAAAVLLETETNVIAIQVVSERISAYRDLADAIERGDL